MARINMQKFVQAGALGVGDELAEFLDRSQGFAKPFQNVTDWYRLGLVGVGTWMQMQGQGAQFTDDLISVGSALGVKSVSNVVRTGAFGGAFRHSLPGATRALPKPRAVVSRMDGLNERTLVTVV